MPIVKDTFDILAIGWQWIGRFGFPLIGALFSFRVALNWITGETITIAPPTGLDMWLVAPPLFVASAAWTLVYLYGLVIETKDLSKNR